MNDSEKLIKIYEFVSKLEDFYYDKLGDDIGKNMFITAQATSYQKVRYFIETLNEQEG